MIMGLDWANLEGVALAVLAGFFILFILLAALRYILARGSARQVDSARAATTTSLQGASLSLALMSMVATMASLTSIITGGVVAGGVAGVVFVAVSKIGGFVNSDAAGIGAVATAIYTMLTCWLIMETRRARRAQEAAVRVQEAAIKAQVEAARGDGEVTARIAASLERCAQALERQQEATRLDARPLPGAGPLNGVSSHDGKPSVKIMDILRRYTGGNG